MKRGRAAILSRFSTLQENDIILCDGNCRRAYHEKCLEPPLDAASLPEDEGWLCPACDAKVLAVHCNLSSSVLQTCGSVCVSAFIVWGLRSSTITSPMLIRYPQSWLSLRSQAARFLQSTL